jgi:hypothetical protein
MTNKDREIAACRLAEIDRRRAELEMVLTTLPPSTAQHEQLEAELAALWRYRVEIVGQLTPATS